jgi:excinuclease ABC subunit C
VAVFLFENGRMRGPAGFSTLGMRIQNEQSGSSSLFAQPLALEPVPEKQVSGKRDQGSEESADGSGDAVTGGSPRLARGMLEARMEAALAELTALADAPSSTVRQAHLALLKRWYYRAEVKRTGEIFFPDAEGHWPVKALLRGAGRVAAKMLTSPTS